MEAAFIYSNNGIPIGWCVCDESKNGKRVR